MLSDHLVHDRFDARSVGDIQVRHLNLMRVPSDKVIERGRPSGASDRRVSRGDCDLREGAPEAAARPGDDPDAGRGSHGSALSITEAEGAKDRNP